MSDKSLLNIHDVEVPLNATERYLYNMIVRQNILIEQMSSFLEAYAKVNKLTTESNKTTVDVKEVEEVTVHVAEVVEVKEDVKEAPVKPKRTRTKK